MGNTVIGFQFIEADSFINGLARVCMNKRGIIDTNGTFVIDPIYEEVSILENNFISIYNGERYGLCNSSGAIIIDLNYLDGFKFTSSRIYACVFIDNYRPWYEIFDYDGNSLMDSIPTKDVLYVSYPDNNTHLVCFRNQKVKENFFCAYDEAFNPIFKEACGYISDFSSFGYAVVIPTPSATRTWTRWEVDEEGLFVIDRSGVRICQLPDLPFYDSQYSDRDGTYKYRYDYYVNDYYVIATDTTNRESRSGYLINLQTLEYSEWKTVAPIKDSNYIGVQDENTELWGLYDGADLVDTDCTKIEYFGVGAETHFNLYHGGEYTTYPS